MKKQILHITMALFLMVSTFGVTITKHYCGEELVDLSLSGKADTCCGMESGCCHDEVQSFQMHEDYTTPIVLEHVDYFSVLACIIPVLLIEQPTQDTFASSLNFGESPPPRDVLHFLSDIQVYRL